MNMKEIRVQFPEGLLEKLDAMVGDKHRSKFIRDAVEGAIKAARHIKNLPENDE